MKIRYSGPHRSVDLMLPNGVVQVERNRTVDVPDETGASLVNGPYWQRAGGNRASQSPEPEPEVVTEAASEPEAVETEQES